MDKRLTFFIVDDDINTEFLENIEFFYRVDGLNHSLAPASNARLWPAASLSEADASLRAH